MYGAVVEVDVDIDVVGLLFVFVVAGVMTTAAEVAAAIDLELGSGAMMLSTLLSHPCWQVAKRPTRLMARK
jgi:hypothetical protein